MNRNAVVWLAAAFAICYFGGGWMFWRGTYIEYLEGNSAGEVWAMPALIAGASVIVAGFTKAGILASAIAAGLSFPAIIATRVELDCARDPTSHNLWPFEIALAIFWGAIVALPAACVGEIIRRVVNRNAASEVGDPPVKN